MKVKRLFLAIIAMVCVLNTSVFAQEMPDHPKYVTGGTSWVDLLDTWEPGKPFSTDANYIDDNFFISRVKLKERFTNVNSQANKNLVDGADKNIGWWCPIGVNDKSWGPMPRYSFNADNFNMWQYLTRHANWSNGWVRVPGAFNDVAHKNGVTTGCLYFVDWQVQLQLNGTSQPSKDFTKLTTLDGTEFKYARKFVQMLKYYGIDGVGIDAEASWNSATATRVQNFLVRCFEVAEELEWPLRIDWYSFVSNSGSLGDSYGYLASNCSDWFQKGGKPVSNMFFMNYNWNASRLATAATTAENLGRSPKDVYAGFDTQGRGFGSSGSYSKWSELAASPVSFVLWGANDRNVVYQSSSESGSADLAIQNTYLKKLEYLFTGGTRNVLNNPAITDAKVSGSEADLKKFHGYSKVASAKSTLKELPFVTRFNLGNGQWFKKDGEISFDHKWYNLSSQDYLPTWRWWIANDAGTVPADPIQCDFTFDDAWYGGSCLKIHGATTKSNVRLFKTKFSVIPSYRFSVTYKVNIGTNPKMQIMVSKEGSEDTFVSIALPASERTGEWVTKSFTFTELGIKSPATIACIGVSVENTDSNYEVLLGEMSILNPTKTYAPVKPTILKEVALKRTYKSVDAKVIFESSPLKAKADGSPVYNEEVDTWYFEVYIKQDGHDPVLVTTTTSWATYVASAPLSDVENDKFQIGIRAVAPDGKTFSDIAWTGQLSIELTPVETLVIDKAVIKPNETFTIGFEDPTHESATFEILNALTGNVAYSASNVKELTTSLPDLGCYDVKITTSAGVTTTRSLIIITPEATGSLPQIKTLEADKTEPAVDETVNLSYTSKKGEGTVSQSLYISDPKAFKVDSKILSGYPFTYSLWFKPEKLEHGSRGIVLMQKLNRNHAWTNNNWGEMWTVIRPEGTGLDAAYKNVAGTTGPNEISLNVWGGGAGSAYPHEIVVDNAISTGYSVTAGLWMHLAITMDANKKQCMYINGHKVFETTSSWTAKLDNTHFYVGGAVQNLAAFTGWIDEVQIWNKALTAEEVKESMDGYFNAPDGLQGYFTFEEVNEDGTFPNNGVNVQVASASVIEWRANQDNASQTDDVQQEPIMDLGVPALEGVRNIVMESVKWLLPGANYSPVDNGATATYGKDGTYPVTLTLKNSWGETTKTIKDYIIVGTGSAIDLNKVTEDIYLYPVPFRESANILFATDGEYKVNVYDSGARPVATQSYQATAGEISTLSFDAPAGFYLVQVIKDGKTVKTFKVSKGI